MLGFWLPDSAESLPGRYGRCVAYCADGCDSVPSEGCDAVQGRDVETDELRTFGVCGHGRDAEAGERCVWDLNCEGRCSVGSTFKCG